MDAVAAHAEIWINICLNRLNKKKPVSHYCARAFIFLNQKFSQQFQQRQLALRKAIRSKI